MESWVKQSLRVITAALAYYFAVRIGLAFVIQPEGLAAVWPASGVALAILLLSPLEMRMILLGTIFVVNTGSNLMSGNSLPVSAGFAIGNTLEPALGFWLINRFFGRVFNFSRLSHLAGIIGAATLSNALTALVGALTPTLAFGASYWDVWLVWWLPDGLGILLLTPLILVWTTQRLQVDDIHPRRVMEALAVSITLFIIILVLPGLNNDNYSPAIILAGVYIVFPLLAWAAMRFELRGTTSMLFLLNLSTLWSTKNGMGIFTSAGDTVKIQLLSAQLYVAVITITTLAMAVIVVERKKLGQALLDANEELRNQINKSEELHKALRAQALRDPLTGLYNRRYLFEKLRQEFSRANREGYPVSLVLIDIDKFKSVNDAHGHDAGDAVLQAVSETLVKAVRTEDTVCRYGGDEFLVVLHNTTLEHARKRVDMWLAKIQSSPLEHAGLKLQISASAGIATFPKHGEDAEQVIKQADIVLLAAKEIKHRS